MDNEYCMIFYMRAKMLCQRRTYKKATHSPYFHLSDHFFCHPMKFFMHSCTFVLKCKQKGYDSPNTILYVQKLDKCLKLVECN